MADGPASGPDEALQQPAVPTWTVLHEEFAQLHGRPVPPLDREHEAAVLAELAPGLAGCDAAARDRNTARAVNEARYRTAVHGLEGAGQTALCLSGGGIRSAAFCLGVLQGLARRGLLGQFHYLSTVSGGGYIGSWLTAWIHRAARHGETLDRVQDRLAHPADLTAAMAAPLAELRRKQQYITPRAGLLSADTWAAVALLQRDLVLNWLVFLPLITAVLLVPRMLEWAVTAWGYYARDPAVGGSGGGSGFAYAFIYLFGLHEAGTPPPYLGWKGMLDVLGAALVLVGVSFGISNRIAREPNQFNDRAYRVTVMLPVVLGALALVVFLAPIAVRGSIPDTFLMVEWILGTLFTFLVARALTAWRRGPRVDAAQGWRDPKGWQNLGIECLALAGAGATAGLLIWCALWLRAMLHPNAMLGLRDMAAFGVPLLLLAYLLGQTIYAGLTSHSRFSPSDREWLARASGYYLLWALAWTVCASLVLFGPRLIDFGHAALVAGGTGALTLGGAVSRFAKATDALSATRERIPVTWLTQIACLVFVAAGTVVLSHATVLVLARLGFANLEGGPLVANAMQAATPDSVLADSLTAQHEAWRGFVLALLAGALGLACSLAASVFVNVNTFSLHALYQARLVRTFLGASNVAEVTGTRPVRNAFTDFSEADDIALSGLGRPPGSPLFPVLGMALNLVKADNLAWQERKACSFLATPLRVGSDQVGYRRPMDEMTLGTAMAISGAAASPNWGYHSSPLVGFVMMLFNIRLGQWLPNPAYATAYGTKMRSFLLMLQEATGRTTDTQPNIYVSDGGHFDNLGLYEMLRRRCRTILVVDASQDERMTLEDLGATLRKAAIDLGITVEFGPLGMARRADPLAPGLYAGVGRILYPEGRSARLGLPRCRGTLIYIKPGAYADVPADVRAYAASNAAFPHDSTGNQFFSESQFESYRTLGSHVVGRVFGKDSSAVPIGRLPGLAARYIRAVMGSARA